MCLLALAVSIFVYVAEATECCCYRDPRGVVCEFLTDARCESLGGQWTDPENICAAPRPHSARRAAPRDLKATVVVVDDDAKQEAFFDAGAENNDDERTFLIF